MRASQQIGHRSWIDGLEHDLLSQSGSGAVYCATDT